MTWTDFKEYSSDVQLQIGQRIQKLRIDKKIAAVDLAAVLDIQSNQMSRIENGRANCTVPQLYVISQILGCSVDYLLFTISSFFCSSAHIYAPFLMCISNLPSSTVTTMPPASITSPTLK